MPTASWIAGLQKLSERHASAPVAASTNAYRGAEQNRLNRNWQPRDYSGDAAIYGDRPVLNQRLRDLFRNDPLMRKLRREMCKGVIGAEGIQTFAEVLLPDGDPGERDTDDAFNFLSDELWETYCEQEFDAEGRSTFQQAQWLNFEEAISAGGAFLLETFDDAPGRMVPLCYQCLEYEQLDTGMDRPGTEQVNRIVQGIEFDARNRPVAYWFYDVHPYDTWQTNTKSTRVPAARVIHTFFPERPSQHLGAPLFAANVQSSKDLDWYLGNELTAAAIGALFAVMIKRGTGAGSGTGFAGDGSDTDDVDQYGNSEAKLGRGIICDLGPNDEVVQVQSNRPNSQAASFIELILRQAGQAAGLSLGRVTGDYKGTSYSASRAMHLDDEGFFKVLRSWCARTAVLPVRRRFTEVAAAYGHFSPVGIGARQFKNRRREMLRLKYQGAGREQLDPEKETSSAVARIRSGLSSHEIECGLRGLNWRRIAMQRAREKAFFDRWDVEPDLSANGAKPGEEAATEEASNAAGT